MDIVISGDTARPGQKRNILRLHGRIHEIVGRAFGVTPRLDARTARDYEAWVSSYENERPAKGDLLIGFELPPNQLGSWVDIRLHPIRFLADDLFSVTSSIPGVAEVVNQHRVEISYQCAKEPREWDVGAFALQVHNDAALLRGGRFASPADALPRLADWAEGLSRVEIVPHPMEPDSPWMNEVMDIPGAVRVEPGAYPVLARVGQVAVWSSSVGVEAPYFHCQPTFIGWEPRCSPPVRLTDELWSCIAEAHRESMA